MNEVHDGTDYSIHAPDFITTRYRIVSVVQVHLRLHCVYVYRELNKVSLEVPENIGFSVNGSVPSLLF